MVFLKGGISWHIRTMKIYRCACLTDRHSGDSWHRQTRCTVGYDPSTGRQKQRSVTGRTQKEVAQKLRQLTAELDAGTYQESTKITLGQWLETWQKEYLFNVKPSTAYLYKQEIAPLDEDQISSFLKAIQGHRFERLYKIALFTGLKQGELLGLQWKSIDLDKGVVTVKQQLRREQKKNSQVYLSSPKNGKIRVLTLAPSVIRLFEDQKDGEDAKKTIAGSA